MAMSNGHSTVQELAIDGASVASIEDYNDAPGSPSSLADEQTLTANGMVASTRPKEHTDRFGFTGGKQFTKDSDWHTPVEVIRRREIKWLDMLDDWDKWMSKKPKKVRERCRKGIPGSIRARAWQYLCGSKKLCEDNKARWHELDSSEGDPKWLEIIQKDLDRQFPFHEMFASREGHGQQDLYRILKAYSIYNPRDGYCQAQAPVAAVLLMHMPAEDAFWALVQICEKYLTGYYSVGLEAVQIDGMVLAGLMKKESYITHKHMKKHKIDAILYMTEWFMCIFSRTLPWPSVLRVWDMFFCEGVKVLFRVALVLLKLTLGRSDQLRDRQGLYETMEVLRNIPESITQEDFLASEMLKLRVFDRDMEEEHSLTLARRRVTKERQLAPEKAAAMARDIDNLRKKKRGKVKPPPTNKTRTDGFGSRDLIRQEQEAKSDNVWPQEGQRHERSSAETERTGHARLSPVTGPGSPQQECVRQVHVDNPPKDWNPNRTETAAVSPTSPGKSPKGKEFKKDKKGEKKKGKVQPRVEMVEPAQHDTSLVERDKGKAEKKDKKSKAKEEKKGKKAEKHDKKHKEKSAHSGAKSASPEHDEEPQRKLSNGHGISDKGVDAIDDVDHVLHAAIREPEFHVLHAAIREPEFHVISPYAEVYHPEHDVVLNDAFEDFTGSQPASPVTEHPNLVSSPQSDSHHHDNHDGNHGSQSPHASIGLETPV